MLTNYHQVSKNNINVNSLFFNGSLAEYSDYLMLAKKQHARRNIYVHFPKLAAKLTHKTTALSYKTGYFLLP